MRNRLTLLMAAVSAIALVTGVAWAAMPNAAVVVANEHAVEVGDAGRVVIARSGAELEIVSVEANAGWTYEIEVPNGREVEADFRSSGRRIQFNAELEEGEIRVRVRERTGSTMIETTSTTAPGSSSTTSGDTTSTTLDGSTSTTTGDDSTSTTLDDSSSTTLDASSSTTTGDDSTSTTIAGSTSTTIDDAPAGSGSETYRVGGVATVTISWSEGRLSLGSVAVADGWSIEKQEVRPDRVVLEFESGDDADAGFEARFDNGSIRVEIDVD